MFCENCGKGLIRGYQFCLECGTPVPAQMNEPEEIDEINEAQDTADEGMPQVGGSGADGGTLVFCPTCGMHMQKSGAFCEKCGMKLQSNSNDQYNNLPKNGDVPLWNTESEDYGYAALDNSEIEQINKFMSGGGITAADDYEPVDEVESMDGFDAVGGIAAVGGAEIESITNQFANMYPSTNTEMPAIGAAAKENSVGERMMENFAMESTNVDNDYIDNGNLPVIEGASMEYDPTEPEPEDPNAFMMTEEAIEDITPTYDDIPSYTEPEAVEETPVYEEPAYEPMAVEETPVYEEPAYEPMAVEETPVYEEPAYEPMAVEETPVYEEPAYEPMAVEETPVYEEPAYEPMAVEEAPVYEEPAYEPMAVEETPVYEEPAYEPMAVEEAPVYEEPAYESEAVEETAVEEPAFAIPVYNEEGDTNEDNYVYGNSGYDSVDTSDIPLFEDESSEDKSDDVAFIGGIAAAAAVSDIPAYEPEAAEELPSYEEPAYEPEPVQDSIFDNDLASEPEENDNDFGSGFMAAAAVSTAVSEPKPSDNLDTKSEVDLGRLIYCRNCGQDMYEKELVCRNCGAPKRPEYQRPSEKKIKKASKPFKLFGVFSIPSLIGILVIIIAVGAILLPSFTASQDITSKPNPAISTTASKTSTTQKAPDELDVGGTAPDTTTSSVTEPVESDPVVPDEPENTTATTTPISTTTSATTAESTTTTAKTTTTSAVQGGAHTPSDLASQNRERDALINAYEVIAGEVGKIDAFATNAVYAIEADVLTEASAAKSFYSSKFGTAGIKSIKEGRSAVTAAVNAARPASGELQTAYNAIKGLESIYNQYYNYVVGTSYTRYKANCAAYMSNFRNYAKSNFSFSALNTSAQTYNDRSQYYFDVIGEAANALDNAASAYYMLNSTTAKLTDATFRSKLLDTFAGNISTYMNAAKYTYVAQAYTDMLAGESYSGAAYSCVNTGYGYVYNLMDVCVKAPYENNVTSFRSSLYSYANSASSAAANARHYAS